MDIAGKRLNKQRTNVQLLDSYCRYMREALQRGIRAETVVESMSSWEYAKKLHGSMGEVIESLLAIDNKLLAAADPLKEKQDD